MAKDRDQIIRRSPSGPIIDGIFGGGAIERLSAVHANQPATATGTAFVPVPSGASPPEPSTLEVKFRNVASGLSVLVLGVVTFLSGSSVSTPEIRAELSLDDGASYLEIQRSAASELALFQRGNVALAAVSPPLTQDVPVLRVRLAWRAHVGDTTATFEIDPNNGGNAQVIAALVNASPPAGEEDDT